MEETSKGHTMMRTPAQFDARLTAEATALRESPGRLATLPPASKRRSLQLFQDIGTEIEAAWSGMGYDESAFPAVVTRVLRERRPHLAVGVMDVVEWVLTTPDLPLQYDVHAIFGEPPVSVFDAPRFHMQVLCWRAGTTAIHEHGFVGGFVVLEGTSLHTMYSFAPRVQVSPHLQVGDVHLTHAELLSPGDVVAITPDLKHNIFHLEAPAATLVVRSGPERGGLKLDYFVPHLAFDPFNVDPLVLRRTQVLRLLLHCGLARHDELAAHLLEECDLATTWDVLEQSCNEIPEPHRAARLVEIARRRHGPVIDELVAVIWEQRRMRHALRLHAAERDPELRFFLALLHSVPRREAILELVGQRFPGTDPHALVRGWAEQLSGVDRIGVDFSDEVNRVLFAALLDGCTPAGTRTQLASSFDAESVAAQAGEVMAYCRKIEETVLAPLFRSERADTVTHFL